MKFRDLSREDKIKLFESWIDGDAIQYKLGGEWEHAVQPYFGGGTEYRSISASSLLDRMGQIIKYHRGGNKDRLESAICNAEQSIRRLEDK